MMIKEFPYESVGQAINNWAKHELEKKKLKYDPEIPTYMQLNNFLSKTISEKPRKVTNSSHFNVPSEHLSGFNKLKSILINGENSNPYLSRKLYDSNFADGLLDYFNCFHFHLGEKKEGKFIKGTKYLALGIVNDNEVFFIQIKPHGNSTWDNIDVLEIVHKERPDLIEQFRVKNMVNISHKISDEKEIHKLKKDGFSFAVTLKDGTSYMPAKLGQVTMGKKTDKNSGGNNKYEPLNLSAVHLMELQIQTRAVFFTINNFIKKFKLINKCIITNVELFDLKGNNNSKLTQFKIKIDYISNLQNKQLIEIFISEPS